MIHHGILSKPFARKDFTLYRRMSKVRQGTMLVAAALLEHFQLLHVRQNPRNKDNSCENTATVLRKML